MLTVQFAQQYFKNHCFFYKRLINQTTIDDFLFKLSLETWASVFEGNGVNTIFNSFLNIFLRHFYSSFPLIKVYKRPSHKLWLTSGILTSCQCKTALYMELKKNNNPLIKKYFRDYCRILSRVIHVAKKMEYDRHILNSNNVMRTSWKLLNKESCNDWNNQGVHSLNINGTSITNHQTIVSAVNKHFTTMPSMITRNIMASNFSTKSALNQNNNSFSLNNV